MNLTNEILAEFVGDIKIQNKDQNKDRSYLYQGRIKNAIIRNNTLLIQCEWLAKKEGNKWVKEDIFASCGYVRNLKLYRISIIRGQLILTPHFTSEKVTLFPLNNENTLDPAKVEGLKLS